MHPAVGITPRFVEGEEAEKAVVQRASIWDETAWQEFPERKELSKGGGGGKGRA